MPVKTRVLVAAILLVVALLFVIPCSLAVVRSFVLPYSSARQALDVLNERVGRAPIPQSTLLVSEYAATACCGNGNHPETELVATRLYQSDLSKEEIRDFYDSLPDSQSLTLVFVDEAIIDYPNRRVFLPCFPYNLFEGHDIPEVMPTGRVLFMVYDYEYHTYPGHEYCD